MANLLVVIQKNQKMIFIKKNWQEIIIQEFPARHAGVTDDKYFTVFFQRECYNYFNKYVTASDSKVKLSCSPMLH